jgi:LemA protein
MMYYTIAASIVCGAAVLWYLMTFNLLVQSRNSVDQAWSNIEVELKRRFDLIANLVETTKGYAKHEADTLRGVTALRNQSGKFADAAHANAAQKEMTQTLGQIMVLAESYPQLRADSSFLNLQTQLTDTENRIATRRHAYNQNVNLYQNRCQFFPSNLVAGLHTFPERAFFDAPDELAAAAPKVSLT